MQVALVKQYTFEAAHRTPWHENESCLHGHSFEVEIEVAGPCDETLGWLVDYAEISERFMPLYDELDHTTLNDVAGMTDVSLGGIQRWIRERLAPELPMLREVRVGIRGEQMFAPKLLHNTMAEDLPERIRFGFEAAHALRKLPPAHKCYTMHGHSFIVEVGAERAEPLIPSLVDVYERLDHQCLNDIDGLENPTSEMIARWIYNEMNTGPSPIETVSVAETCTARCIYRGR